MIQDLWEFLLDEQNREALKIVGSVVAALVIAGWALYRHFSKRSSPNLGIVYMTRGDLDRAEQMYRKSLTLFTALGNPQMIKKVEGLLNELDSKKKG